MPVAAAMRLALGFSLLGLCGLEAHADFRLCNNTTGKVGISLGYKDNDGWVTEGWWNLGPRSCETLLRGKWDRLENWHLLQDLAGLRGKVKTPAKAAPNGLTA